MTHWKRLWCWEGLGAGGEGDDRGWDGWIASPAWRTWVWVNSGSWWRTGRPGVLQFIGSQRVGHDWVTEVNWTELKLYLVSVSLNSTPFYFFSCKISTVLTILCYQMRKFGFYFFKAPRSSILLNLRYSFSRAVISFPSREMQKQQH